MARWFHGQTGLGWAGPPRTRAPGPVLPAMQAPNLSFRLPSVRRFQGPAPDPALIAGLIRAAYGQPEGGSRAVPSAGGIYGLEFFVLTLADGGLWQVGPHGERIDLEMPEWDDPAAPLFHQISGPAAVLLLAARSAPYLTRYGLRGYRYMLIEAGHCAQELIRGARAAGLRTCPLGAFDDACMTQAVGGQLTDRMVIYALALGAAEAAP